MSALLAEKTPYERFCALLASLVAHSTGEPSMALYERLKAEFTRDVPDATPQQYEYAMRLAAKAAGV